MTTNIAREEVLGKVRAALGRASDSPIAPIPSSARVGPRTPRDPSTEIDQLLTEIGKLTSVTKRLSQPADLKAALAELVAAEQVKKATLWQTPELQQLGVAASLSELGVEIISPYADNRAIAACDLGVTGVDAALPETGTLLLRGPRVAQLIAAAHAAVTEPPVPHASALLAVSPLTDGDGVAVRFAAVAIEAAHRALAPILAPLALIDPRWRRRW